MQDEEYAINEDFQQTALQLADALDLDEIESARIALEALGDAEMLGRPLLESSIIRFHQTRKYLLDSFRHILYASIDVNIPESIRDVLLGVIIRVLQPQESSGAGQSFVSKCLQKMGEMKSMLQSLTDRLNGASVLGQIQRSEFHETIEYQRASLVQQHESLGIIVHYLVKANHAAPKDFEQILDILKRADKYDNLLGESFFILLAVTSSTLYERFGLTNITVHLIPALSAFIFVFGAPEGHSNLREARDWNEKIVGHKDQNPWVLHYVHAAMCAWWLAEYSGWYMDNQTGSPLVGVNLDEGRFISIQSSSRPSICYASVEPTNIAP